MSKKFLIPLHLLIWLIKKLSLGAYLCSNSHWEYECPRLQDNDNNEDLNNCECMNYIEKMDPIYAISLQEFYNFTLEQLEQSKQEVARMDVLEILNEMDEESR